MGETEKTENTIQQDLLRQRVPVEVPAFVDGQRALEDPMSPVSSSSGDGGRVAEPVLTQVAQQTIGGGIGSGVTDGERSSDVTDGRTWFDALGEKSQGKLPS